MLKPTLLHLFLFPLLVLAQNAAQASATVASAASATAPASSQQTPNTGYNGGDDNPIDPTDAGAAGSSKGAFSLSKGAMAAIIVVVVIVAVGGIASAVLFWLAKKRQWDVRQSLRRASRRLTGRSDVTATKRQNRRTGVRLNSPPPGRSVKKEQDLEKGVPASSGRGKTTTTISSTFDVETPTSKGWKASVLGGKK